MDASLFTIHLEEFVKKHGIPADLNDRIIKVREEVNELADAVADGNIEAIIKEACDVIIVCWHILLICGVHQPIWKMYLKLQEVASRPHYQEMARRIEGEK